MTGYRMATACQSDTTSQQRAVQNLQRSVDFRGAAPQTRPSGMLPLQFVNNNGLRQPPQSFAGSQDIRSILQEAGEAFAQQQSTLDDVLPGRAINNSFVPASHLSYDNAPSSSLLTPARPYVAVNPTLLSESMLSSPIEPRGRITQDLHRPVKPDVTFTADDKRLMKMLRDQPVPESWCSITYYELDVKVAETFKVPNHYGSVLVDGYVDPTGHTGGNRICLGALSNIHREDQSEKTRMHIGQGVRLERREESDVWLTNLSEYSVFVHSYYLDREAGREPGQAVHKIYPGACIKVFDLRQCFIQLMQHARMAQEAAAAGNRRLAGNSASAPGDDASAPKYYMQQLNVAVGVDDFVRFCLLRISFVKGWGPDYAKRPEIRHTPCWIEVQIQRALQLLDEVLRLVPALNNARGQEYS